MCWVVPCLKTPKCWGCEVVLWYHPSGHARSPNSVGVIPDLPRVLGCVDGTHHPVHAVLQPGVKTAAVPSFPPSGTPPIQPGLNTQHTPSHAQFHPPSRNPTLTYSWRTDFERCPALPHGILDSEPCRG